MNLKSTIAIVSLGMSIYACDSDTTSNEHERVISSPFETACEISGGEIVGGEGNQRCKCSEETCDAGVVCNLETKKCPLSIGGSCKEGDQYCSSGKVYNCNNNKWNYEKECLSGLGCLADNSKCAECNQDSCAEGKIKKCVNGKYSEAEVCVSKSCEDAYSCKDECIGNEVVCRDSQLYRCENNKLTPSDYCHAGCDLTTNNTCAKECAEGNTICIAGKIKTCTEGKYSEGVECNNGYSCSANGITCGICVNGSKRCVDDVETGIGHMEVCVDGAFEYLENGINCEKDNSCDVDNNTCGECNNTSENTICKNEDIAGYQSVGFLYKCENGKYAKERECVTEGFVRFSCNKDGTTCGNCLNNVPQCVIGNPSRLLNCTDGKFVEEEVCENGCDKFMNTCSQ